MAKKKSKIPAYVLKQFEKAMYKAGDRVIIKWLGQTKTGYVKHSKENAWGRSYMVEVTEKGLKRSDDVTRYPCGIEIRGHRTQYDVGFILHDRTQSGDWPQSTRIYEDSVCKADSQRDDNKSVGGNDDSASGKDTRSRSSDAHQNVVESGSTRKRTSNANTPSKDLDDAVNRQKDFLQGFVKD